MLAGTAAPSVVHADAVAPKLTQPPKLKQFVAAAWPEAEKAAGRSATVVLRLDIDAAGVVTRAEVVESAGAAFDAAAQAAALQFQFEPAQWDGVPGPVRIVYRYAFTWKEPPRLAVLAGRVRDADTGRPVVGHRIVLQELPAAATLTNADGRFELRDLPPGPVTATLRGGRYDVVTVREALVAGQRLEVRYTVALQGKAAPQDGDDYEVVVRAPPLRRETVAVQVDASQAARVPGGQGDVLKVVESMPGVARAAVGSGDVVVWGSAPGQSRTYVDGVPLPRLYHQGGLRSVVHTDLVQSVELLPGGYGPNWGRGLGAVVAVQSKSLRDEASGQGGNVLSTHASAALDPLEASGRLSVPLPGVLEGAILSASGRYGWLDKTAGLVLNSKTQEVFPIPSYRDGQLRLDVPVGPGRQLDVTWLRGSDAVTKTLARSDPAERVSDRQSADFDRVYLRFRQQLGDRSDVSVVPYWGLDHSTQQALLGLQSTSAGQDSWSAGLRATWRGMLANATQLQAGLDIDLQKAALQRKGAVGAPPREGDIRVFGQAPPEQVAADQWQVLQTGVAPWVLLSQSWLGGALVVEPGLRLDPLVRSVSRKLPLVGAAPEIGLYSQDLSIEPRLQVRGQPTAGVRLRAAWALVAQPPAAADLSASFGNPALGNASGQHVVAGAEVDLAAGVTAEVVAFHLNSDDMATRSPLAQPLLAQALVAAGQGRTQGAQLTLRAAPFPGLFGWLSYTWSKAERKDGAGAWRLSGYDQTHLLSAALAYKPGLGLDFAVRFRLASGAPRTPVVGAWYDALRDRWQPVFGAHNADRLPLFVQLDVSAARRWTWPRGWLEAYVEVQNVTAHRNIEDYVYSADYSLRDGLGGLPLLPLAGVRCGY